MKKLLYTAMLVLLSVSLSAETHLREKVYVSTDKSVYVAGDQLWLSAYCMDVNTGKLSDFSRIAYVEIHSNSGMVQTGKVALYNGRGAGRITLDNTLPTGNYVILAYTAQSANEEGFDYSTGERTISVFNTFTTDREKDGVEMTESVTPDNVSASSFGGVSVSAPSEAKKNSSATLKLTNSGKESVSLDLSVYHNDGIAAPKNSGIVGFTSDVKKTPAAKGFKSVRVPEYEGEVIYTKVTGIDQEGMKDVALRNAFISAPGSEQNVYSTVVDENGDAEFFTSNIYGTQDMFLEIENLPENRICHLEVVSPFVDVLVSGVSKLQLSSKYASQLQQRSLGMQIGKAFDADTLYEWLPANEHQLFDQNRKRYVLDDYTRFPVMEELFVEYIPELRVRRVGGSRELQVRMDNIKNASYFSVGTSLLMVDGIPVLDQEKVLSYDPLLVKYIDIYQQTYYLGTRGFSGVVNFITYKGSLPGMQFADNVRIVNFIGPEYPMAFTCKGVGSDYPDYRQTIYWHPMITLAPGESIEVECKTPAYDGTFDIAVEGITESGEPVSASNTFSTR